MTDLAKDHSNLTMGSVSHILAEKDQRIIALTAERDGLRDTLTEVLKEFAPTTLTSEFVLRNPTVPESSVVKWRKTLALQPPAAKRVCHDCAILPSCSGGQRNVMDTPCSQFVVKQPPAEGDELRKQVRKAVWEAYSSGWSGGHCYKGSRTEMLRIIEDAVDHIIARELAPQPPADGKEGQQP